MTRDNQLGYFHALTEGTFTPRYCRKSPCILGALRMQKVIGRLVEAVVWTDQRMDDAEKLKAVLGLSVQVEMLPLPRLPDERWQLTPARVGAASRDRAARRWWVRAGTLLILLLLGIIATFGVRFYLLHRHRPGRRPHGEGGERRQQQESAQ